VSPSLLFSPVELYLPSGWSCNGFSVLFSYGFAVAYAVHAPRFFLERLPCIIHACTTRELRLWAWLFPPRLRRKNFIEGVFLPFYPSFLTERGKAYDLLLSAGTSVRVLLAFKTLESFFELTSWKISPPQSGPAFDHFSLPYLFSSFSLGASAYSCWCPGSLMASVFAVPFFPGPFSHFVSPTRHVAKKQGHPVFHQPQLLDILRL